MYSNNSGQLSGLAETGEEAGNLDSMDDLAKRMIRTEEEALLNNSQEVPMSQKGHEMADAWKAELDKLKKVGVAHTCSTRRWVWHIVSGSGCGTM